MKTKNPILTMIIIYFCVSLAQANSSSACHDSVSGKAEGPQPYIRQSLGIKGTGRVKLFRGLGNSETGAIDGFTTTYLTQVLFDNPAFWLGSRFFQDAYATASLKSLSPELGLAKGEEAVYAEVEKTIRKNGPFDFVQNEVTTQPLVGQYLARSSTTLVLGSTLASARAEAIKQNRILQKSEDGLAVVKGNALLIFEVNVAAERVVRGERQDNGSSQNLVLSHIEGREIDAIYVGTKLFENRDIILWNEVRVVERSPNGNPSKIQVFELGIVQPGVDSKLPFEKKVLGATISKSGVLYEDSRLLRDLEEGLIKELAERILEESQIEVKSLRK